jgi:hypothetical protein
MLSFSPSVFGPIQRMFEVQTVARSNGLWLALLVGGAGHDLALSLQIRAELLSVRLPQHCDIAGRDGRRIHQDETRHARRMSKRILQREDCAPRVPEQRRCIQLKVLWSVKFP